MFAAYLLKQPLRASTDAKLMGHVFNQIYYVSNTIHAYNNENQDERKLAVVSERRDDIYMEYVEW